MYLHDWNQSLSENSTTLKTSRSTATEIAHPCSLAQSVQLSLFEDLSQAAAWLKGVHIHPSG